MYKRKKELDYDALEKVTGGSSESNLMPITVGATYQGIYMKLQRDVIGRVYDIRDGMVYYYESEFDDFHGDYHGSINCSLSIEVFRDCFFLK